MLELKNPDDGCLEFNLKVVAGQTRKLKLELKTPDNGCSEFNLLTNSNEFERFEKSSSVSRKFWRNLAHEVGVHPSEGVKDFGIASLGHSRAVLDG
jgi:hypothetical protein